MLEVKRDDFDENIEDIVLDDDFVTKYHACVDFGNVHDYLHVISLLHSSTVTRKKGALTRRSSPPVKTPLPMSHYYT